KYFKEFKEYKNLNPLIAAYKNSGNHSSKKNWIHVNPVFIESLRAFRNELKRKMFKNAVRDITSYLKCDHELNEHLDDLKHYTHLIISEFVLVEKPDVLTNIFEKIFSDKVGEFPKSILNKNEIDSDSFDTSKNEFLNQISFDEQLGGIYNLYRQKR